MRRTTIVILALFLSAQAYIWDTTPDVSAEDSVRQLQKETEGKQLHSDPSSIGEWFERYSGNPLNIPKYDGLGVVHPDMIFFPAGEDGYRYWMFYTPYPPDSTENPCLVRSNDGVNFVDAGLSNPLIIRTQPWEAIHQGDPDVIKVGNQWFMYYMGRDFSLKYSIGLAISQDGKNWQKYDQNPVIEPVQSWENNWVGAPTLYYDGQKFWMWFCGGFDQGIELASSPDGKVWTRENQGQPVLTGTTGEWDSGGVSHPDVIYYNDTLWMYYWGCSGPERYLLGLAKSTDKFTWVKCQYNPVLEIVNNTWEGLSIYRSSPVIINDTMWLYYSAYDTIAVPHIGVAWSWNIKQNDVNPDGSGIHKPPEFTLFQNYPNPFNPVTEISYSLPRDCYVKLSVYNIIGERVKTLVDGFQSGGHKIISWNGTGESGEKLATGVYFYTLRAGDIIQTKKMLLMK